MTGLAAEPDIWKIDRSWLVSTADGEKERRTTADLSGFRCLVLLGAAGAGKTTEEKRLADQEHAFGCSVRRCRLAEYAGTSADLSRHLAELAEGADGTTVFYLDALDEAMIPLPRSWDCGTRLDQGPTSRY